MWWAIKPNSIWCACCVCNTRILLYQICAHCERERWHTEKDKPNNYRSKITKVSFFYSVAAAAVAAVVYIDKWRMVELCIVLVSSGFAMECLDPIWSTKQREKYIYINYKAIVLRCKAIICCHWKSQVYFMLLYFSSSSSSLFRGVLLFISVRLLSVLFGSRWYLCFAHDISLSFEAEEKKNQSKRDRENRRVSFIEMKRLQSDLSFETKEAKKKKNAHKILLQKCLVRVIKINRYKPSVACCWSD